MRTRILVSGVIIALVILIGGTIYYLNIPDAAPTATALISSNLVKPHDANAGTEGSMEAVMTPPKTFAGRLSPEATSLEEFSSNPKRDPSEQLVLDVAAE